MNSTTDSNPGCPPLLRNAPSLAVTRLIALISLIAVATALVVLFVFDPIQNSFYPLCVFHQVTGLNCPGCGSLRALHELLHGRFLAALHANALLMFTLPFAVWVCAQFLIQRLRGKNTADIRPGWLWAFLTVMILFTVLRNFPEFAWLSP